MIKTERRASWLELFYDLVFVIIIAKLSHYLLLHPTLSGLLIFSALFIMTWWMWMGFSYYADMYERDHWAFRTTLYLSMLGVIAFAISLQNIDSHYQQVILAYLALRCLLWGIYVFSWYHFKADRPFLIFYVTGFALGLIFWSGSLIVPHYFVLLACLGFALEFLSPLCAYLFAKTTPQQISHMDERFGLFLLIVLGETIASVTYATGASNLDWHNIFICVVSFMIAISMWKIYFSRIQEHTVYKALRGTRLDMLRSFAFGNSHALIAIAIVIFGVSLEWLILAENTLNPHITYILSIAFYILVVTLNQWAGFSLHTATDFIRRFGAVALILILGAFIHNTLIMSLLTAIIICRLSQYNRLQSC